MKSEETRLNELCFGRGCSVVDEEASGTLRKGTALQALSALSAFKSANGKSTSATRIMCEEHRQSGFL
ncbi:MAG TPA: hypothetical protein VI588_04330 [Candidatus Gracilibacteria bacterium]|nr:hypothetical protein [Candidatus Gracilibacteria bacterium]